MFQRQLGGRLAIEKWKTAAKVFGGAGEIHKAQAIVSGGGGFAIVLTVSLPLSSYLLCCEPFLGAAYFDGFPLDFEALLWDVRTYLVCVMYCNSWYTGNPGDFLSQRSCE